MILKSLLQSDLDDVFFNTDEFANSYRYISNHGISTLDLIPITADGGTGGQGGQDLARDPDLTIRGADFLAKTSDFESSDIQRLPQGGDYIEGTEPEGTFYKWYVFPRVNDNFYTWTDHGKDVCKIHTVGQESFTSLKLRPVNHVHPFEVRALLSTPRTFHEVDTLEGFVGARQLTTAYIDAGDVPEGISQFDRGLRIEQLDSQGKVEVEWNVDLNETRWNPRLIRLGLQRSPLLARNEMRSAPTL